MVFLFACPAGAFAGALLGFFIPYVLAARRGEP